MFSIAFSLLFLLLAASAYFLKRRNDWRNSPPGPRGLPFIGSVLSMEKLWYMSYCKWAKQYGPIFRVDLLTSRNVVISDHKLVKEMFTESVFSGRMDLSALDVVGDGQVHGIISTEGEEWEELKRFTVRQLREFGVGKTSMEESIMMDVNELIDRLQTKEGTSVGNIKESLLLAVVNSLWAIVTGTRYKQNDAALLQMTNDLQNIATEILERGALHLFAPTLSRLFPTLSGFTQMKKRISNFSASFLSPQIEQHREHLRSYSEDSSRDFIDAFMREIRNTSNPKSAFFGEVGEKHLRALLSDLYNAGTDTTSSTLSFMILYLSKNPQVQRKFQEEITSITGNTRSCSIKDRAKMPYTEAVIAETLRYSIVLPQAVGHRAVKDQEFHGYMIPKDTFIYANLYYIHHDPQIWGDPKNFRPERFLSADGTKFKKHEGFMPFGVGRRQCLGEALARDSIFLFSTNIFQRFWIDFDKTGPDHGFESKIHFVLSPKPYNVILRDRLMM